MYAPLSDIFFVANRQIEIKDIPIISDSGFKTIICNRPNAEEESQPLFDDIAKEAEKHGIKAIYLPIEPSKINQPLIESFINLMSESSPILGYCRTGTRVTILWSLAEKLKGTPSEEIIKSSQLAGYDVKSFIK